MATQTATLTVAAKSGYTLIINNIPSGSSVTPVNDIQTWLHCGNIWDKNYTTISQILSDATVLLALISSNNAVDYMARSTNWASTVVSNSTAMSYIGNNNYCANKLLGDSTWFNAICNSTYFESVLTVKVPTMTSYNQPSGQVIYSGDESDATSRAWFVFGGYDSESNRWWSNGTLFGQACFIGYMFTNNIAIKKVAVKFLNGITHSYVRLQGSNDNANYTNVGTEQDVVGGSLATFNVSNASKYKYWRLYIRTQTQTTSRTFGGQINIVQFYGRA